MIRNPPINVGLNVGHLPCLLLLLLCGRVLVVHHQPTVLLHRHPVVHLRTCTSVKNRAKGDWVTNLLDVVDVLDVRDVLDMVDVVNVVLIG